MICAIANDIDSPFKDMSLIFTFSVSDLDDLTKDATEQPSKFS